MEKLNIAELLKDCPKGMELDCTILENVTFEEVRTCCSYPIKIITDGYAEFLTEYGCLSYKDNAKCVIFPKGKTTWEGFQRPFKDGDVIVSEKGDIHLLSTLDSSYCAFRESWVNKLDRSVTTGVHVVRFATEEEKQKLFDAIKANGYKWNAETKTLEKLIVPKFKVGDRIKCRSGETVYRIVHITEDSYVLDNLSSIYISIEHMYDLVPNKFDITTLKPFDKVLVRQNVYGKWEIDFFGYYNKGDHHTTGSCIYKQCIPYESNEQLLGTTNDCDDFYKTWE